ncbi:MAG: lipid A biosynthesis acyltransferase [Cellvibrionaceae bacterium]
MTKDREFLAPRYWPTWLAIWSLQLWGKLPWRLRYGIARILGFVAFHLARRRRHIVDVNLSLAFPEWSKKERRQKVADVLFNNVIGLAEASNVYQTPIEELRQNTTIKGQEVLEKAIAQGRGVLLLGAHYSHLDLGGALVSLVCQPTAIYRPNNNPLMDHYIKRGRMTFMRDVILRSDMRGIAKALKKGDVVWYPPDQDYGRSHAVYAPFFGVNASTIIATSRLVKFNRSPVVVMSVSRNGKNAQYTLEFQELPAEIPSGDDVRDATIVNQALEHCIRKAPTQYMWTHRRFKTQPDGRAKLYN